MLGVKCFARDENGVLTSVYMRHPELQLYYHVGQDTLPKIGWAMVFPDEYGAESFIDYEERTNWETWEVDYDPAPVHGSDLPVCSVYSDIDRVTEFWQLVMGGMIDDAWAIGRYAPCDTVYATRVRPIRRIA